MAALGAGYFYARQADKLYSSAAEVYVTESGPKIVGDHPTALSSAKNFLTTQAKLMRSTPVFELAVERIDPDQLESFPKDVPRDALLNTLRGGVQTHQMPGNDIIIVSFIGPDPNDATTLVNHVVDAYVEFQGEQKRSTALEVLRILNDERFSREVELDNINKQLAKIERDTSMLIVGDQRMTPMASQLEAMAATYSEAKIETVKAYAALDTALRNLDVKPNPDDILDIDWDRVETTVASSPLTKLDVAIESLEEKHAELVLRLGPEHKEVERVEIQLEVLRSKQPAKRIAALRALIESYTNEYVEAQQRESQIKKSIDDLNDKATEMNLAFGQHARLMGEKDRITNRLIMLDDQIKTLRIDEDAGVLNVFVVEHARVNPFPISPNVEKTVAVAGLLGAMFGLAAVFLYGMLDQRIRSADELRQAVDLPMLGIIPVSSDGDDVCIVGRTMHLAPNSESAEAYRMVRASLMLQESSKGQHAQVILVSSPSRGDGKSTTCSNLAIAFANLKHRTLIIDCDLRTPNQHRIFECKQSPGINEALRQSFSLQEAIQPTRIDSLDLLSCGLTPSDPSEMISDEAFLQLLTRLRKRYDRIFIDSPPLLSVSDGRTLSSYADTTMLVLRATRSTRQAYRLAHEVLQNCGASVAGIVFNGVSQAGVTYSYARYGDMTEARPKKGLFSKRQRDAEALALLDTPVEMDLTDEAPRARGEELR